MPFVIDASVAACWLMPDEGHAVADAARGRMAQDSGVVPTLWWFEVRNLLIVNERRGRLDEAQTSRALMLLGSLPIVVDRSPDEASILVLARRHRLTVYDAAYLELAQRLNGALATLDKALATAARAEGIALLEPV